MEPGIVEKLEIKDPEPRLIKMAETVMEQNQMILEMNKKILQSVIHFPPVTTNEELEKIIKS